MKSAELLGLRCRDQDWRRTHPQSLETLRNVILGLDGADATEEGGYGCGGRYRGR